MAKRMNRIVLALALGMTLASASAVRAAAEEQVDNPAYKSWASHKPGTVVTTESKSGVAGQTFTSEITQKLVEVTPENAVIETTMKISVPGVPAQPARKVTIPAKVAKSQATPGKLPPGVKGEMNDKGTEKLTVAGKSYSCKVYEFTGESNGGQTTGKMWSSDQIPGGMAKMESNAKVSGQDATMTMEVTKIDAK